MYVSDAARAAFEAAGTPPGISFADGGEQPVKGGKTIRVFAMREARIAKGLRRRGR